MVSLDTLIGIAGLVVGVVGLVVGYVYFLKSKRVKKPCFELINNNLVEGYSAKLKELNVAYRGRTVENLTVTKIIFWNDGHETINFSDLTVADLLRIECGDEFEILDTTVTQMSKTANQLTCTLLPDLKQAIIQFDYLDKDHGGVIQVIHTGTQSDDIAIVGTIKGVSQIEGKVSPTVVRIPEFNARIPRFVITTASTLKIIGGGVATVFGALIFVAMVLELYRSEWRPILHFNTLDGSFVVAMLTLSLIGAMMFLMLKGIITVVQEVKKIQHRPPRELSLF